MIRPSMVLWDGQLVDQVVQFFPAVVPGGALLVPVEGWVWWQLLSFRYFNNNGAAAVPAGLVLVFKQGSQIVYQWELTPLLAAGATIDVSACIEGHQQVAGVTFWNAILPRLVIAGSGSIGVNQDGGDGNTQFTVLTFTFIGHRFTNRSG